MRGLGLIAAILWVAQLAAAQGSCNFAQTPSGSKAPSSSVSQNQDATGSATPTRVIEKKTEEGGRTIVTHTLETLNVDGQWTATAVCVDETQKISNSTTRATQRSYGFDADHNRVLLESTTTDTTKRGSGSESVVSATSQPDSSGSLRVTRKTVSESRATAPNTTETKTTVMLPDVNGGLAPGGVTREVRVQHGPGVEQVRTTQMLPDGNGGWKTSEVREEMVRKDAQGNSTTEQKLYQPDANMNMSLTQRTVSKETKDAGGSRQDVKTYSIAPTGSIDQVQLDSTMQVVSSTASNGKQTTVTNVEQRDPLAPAAGLQTTQITVQVSKPDGQGGKKTETVVKAPDPNGRMTEVTVSFGDTKK